MGFAATRDVFCRRGDLVLQGVLQCVMVVDDILLYDKDYTTHLSCQRSPRQMQSTRDHSKCREVCSGRTEDLLLQLAAFL